MSKKGISPLVATVLLVAFSIALGALVMSWGQEYIEQKAEFVKGVREVKSGCDLVDLKIIKIENIPQVCIKEKNKIQVWFDNGAHIDIFNINAKIIGTEGVSSTENILKTSLMRLNAIKSEFFFEDVGEVKQIQFIPKVYLVDKAYFCPESILTIENIPEC
jgi:flagellin-like protein